MYFRFILKTFFLASGDICSNLQVMVANESADIAPENLVVRFSEAVDGFPLPKGHSQNPDLQAPQKPEGEAFLKDR